MTQFYPNTPENRASLGLSRLPEYVSGDPGLPLIAHDTTTGRFAFVAAWAAPVAAPTPPRYFYWDHEDGSYEETTADAETEATEDRLVVSATPIAGGFRLYAESYYSSEGRFALEVTRPLAEALAVFSLALAADSRVEAREVSLTGLRAVATHRAVAHLDS